MKKLILALAAFALAAPSAAYAHERPRHERPERHYHRDRDRTGEIILGIVAGVIINEALDGRDRYYDRYYEYPPRRYDYPDRYNRDQNRRDCFYDGRVDRYGRTYYVWICR